MNLKLEIEHTLFIKSSNKLNSRKTEYLETTNAELFERILRETLFLPKEATLHERIYCILNEMTSIPLCPFCWTKKSYALYRGYRNTCGNARCGAKLRYSKQST